MKWKLMRRHICPEHKREGSWCVICSLSIKMMLLQSWYTAVCGFSITTSQWKWRWYEICSFSILICVTITHSSKHSVITREWYIDWNYFVFTHNMFMIEINIWKNISSGIYSVHWKTKSRKLYVSIMCVWILFDVYTWKWLMRRIFNHILKAIIN